MTRRVRTPETDSISGKHRIGQQLDLTVTHLDEDGYGSARHDGRQILVSGALPGELVRVQLTHVGRKTDHGSVVAILRRNRSRLVSPPCAHANYCDGCPLIQMSYQSQLIWKQQLVSESLRRYDTLGDVPVLPVLPSGKRFAYRNSAKLVVSGKFNEPVVGIYRRSSHHVIDIGDCPLHHPLINRVVQAVKEGVRKGKVPIYSQRTDSGLLRYLVVRVSELENSAMVTFVSAERGFNEFHHLSKFLQAAVPEVSVVLQNVNSSSGNIILGDKDYFITKKRNVVDAIGPVRLSLSPRSFFQVNNDAARQIYETVQKWADLRRTETVLDLYCGIGGISLYLAGNARQVIGVEVVDAAVSDAESNAQMNGVRNCSFMAGDVAELLEDFRDEHATISLAILNPPRSGCESRVLKDLAALTPQKIIYVSCSPRSLARDLDILAGLGFRTHQVQPVDMFPQTPHVESVALLQADIS